MVTVAVMKHRDQKQLGGVRVKASIPCYSLKEIRTRTQEEQEPGRWS